VSGLDTVRLDLLSASEIAALMGFLPADMTISEFFVWVVEPERWPARMSMTADLGPAAFAEMLGTEPQEDVQGSLSFDIALADFDDETLVVEVPGVGFVGPGA
jgi:hypothetical protein